MLDALWQDLRYAVRALRSRPGFAAVTILSLALEIGANSAIFSLIDAVMLKSLPVKHPEELLQVTMATPQFFSNPIWEQIRDRQDVFSGIFAYGRWALNLAAGGEARGVFRRPVGRTEELLSKRRSSVVLHIYRQPSVMSMDCI